MGFFRIASQWCGKFQHKEFRPALPLVAAAALFTLSLPACSQTIPTNGLLMWFKADNGVTLSQGRVATWIDQSGGNSNATQTTAGNQPQLVSNVLNGKPVVRFDGTSDSLRFIQRMDGFSGATLIIVSASAGDPQGVYAGGESAPLYWPEYKPWGMLYLSPYQTSVRYRFGTGQANNLPMYTRPSVGGSFSITTAVKSGTAESVYVDGQLRQSWTSASSTLSGISDAGTIGFGANKGFAGDIAEILVYNRAVTASERQAIEGNLTGKYFTVNSVVSGTQLNPGDNIQAAINANPGATTFVLNPGVYRLLELTPKSGNTFRGSPGTILTGANLLTSFTRSGQYWVAYGQTQGTPPYGQCQAATPGCMYNEDLFLDDKPLKHVTSLGAVGPGSWYFDYGANAIYMADDPNGHRMETSVARTAFSGSATNVTIDGITVEKYASPAQYGAIGGQYPGQAWTIQNCTIRWNHGAGIRIVDRAKLLNSTIMKNGQIGISASGADVLIEGNDISYNHYAGFNPSWEAGAVKFSNTTRIVVRNNNSHDNTGLGLWTDGDNINALYEGNTVINNAYGGISHEISYSAIIRNNIVKYNGSAYWPWLWGGQIQVQNSQNVEVYNNQVTVGANGGNGIVLIQQSRGNGQYGPYLTINNYVHNNSITFLGASGMTGGAADWNPSQFFSGNNVFNSNNYHTYNQNNGNWAWASAQRNWSNYRSLGLEPNSTIDGNVVP